MLEKLVCLFIILPLTCFAQPVMDYRSVSFHMEPDSQTIILAASLGFNNVCLQTEGNTRKRLQSIRETENNKGYFRLAQSLGMSVSLWLHELDNYDTAWGKISTDNVMLWDQLNERYSYYLNTLFPEINYVVLTVVETQINISDEKVFIKLVNLINDACRKYNKKLILRSFTHLPSELTIMENVLDNIPLDVIIENKMVACDWNMRAPVNPFISKVKKHTQFIELDIAGEYYRGEYVPNYFANILVPHFNYWKELGCKGISVRIDRSPHNAWWEPLKFTHRVTGQVQEANLWLLGYLASGKTNDTQLPLMDFCRKYFGEKASPLMAKAIEPTGEILAEALSVENEVFGVTRNPMLADWTMNGKHCKCGDTIARKYEDDEDMLYRNPFYSKYSPWVWVDSLKPVYELIRRGASVIVDRKTKAYEENLLKINQAIEIIRNLKTELNPETYRYYLFKFEEGRFNLTVMCEMELAWLKASQRLYYKQGDIILLKEVKQHLKNLQYLQSETKYVYQGKWNNRYYRLERGEYLDIAGYIKMFEKYWQLN